MKNLRAVQPDGSGCCGSVLTAPVDVVTAAQLAKGYAASGHPARLRLVSILAASENGEICVCDLVEPIGTTQGTVSHHLKILSDAGLVTADRRGKWAWYSIVPERLEALHSALTV